MSALADARRAVAPARLVGSTLYHDKGYAINELRYTVPIDHRGSDDEERITITVRVVLGHGTAAVRSGEADVGDKTDRHGDDGIGCGHGRRIKVSACPMCDGCGVLVDSDIPVAVYLVGGPGSDNPPTAHPAVNDFYLAKGFQMLYMDYRGTGSSHALRADHRRPGRSVATTTTTTTKIPRRLDGLTPEQQADRLSLFRQDNIVRDLEAVRRSLAVRQWTLVGQSYGGWIAFSYLSFYPHGLHMVLVTGGVPPVGQPAARVYAKTYRAVIAACDAFYDAYPHHEESVRRVLEHIAATVATAPPQTPPTIVTTLTTKISSSTQTDAPRIRPHNAPYRMPGGGHLTPERFLCLGRMLGTTDGAAKVDAALTTCVADLEGPRRRLTRATLRSIEGWLRFEARPLYAVLQEAIYAEPGLPPTAWAAESAGRALPQYWWLWPGALERVFGESKTDMAEGSGMTTAANTELSPGASPEASTRTTTATTTASSISQPDTTYRRQVFDGHRVYLSAEHVYRCHFAARNGPPFRALLPLRAAADLLAQRTTGWTPLYDSAQLRRNAVPVAALSYARDLFIDWELAQDTLRATGTVVSDTSTELMHTAVKDASDEVLPWLWRLLGDAVEMAVRTQESDAGERAGEIEDGKNSDNGGNGDTSGKCERDKKGVSLTGAERESATSLLSILQGKRPRRI